MRALIGGLLILFGLLPVTQAEVVSLQTAAFKMLKESQWQQQALPHSWSKKVQDDAITTGEYRIPFILANDAVVDHGRAYAVLLNTMHSSATISINGIKLFAEKTIEGPLPRYWNTPIIIPIPKSALKDTDNTLNISLHTHSGNGALVSPLLGPIDEISDIYLWREFVQLDLNKYAFSAMIIVAIFSLFLASSDRSYHYYLYFSGAAFLFNIYQANFFIINIPTATKTWLWLVNIALDWWVILTVFFAHRLCNQYYPRFEQALLSYGIAVTAIYGISNIEDIVHIANRIHLVSLGLIAYLAISNGAKWNSKNHRLICLITSAIVILFSYDITVNNSLQLFTAAPGIIESWRWEFQVAPIAVTLLWTAMLWQLVKNYADLAAEAEDLQKNLEAKLATTKAHYEKEKLEQHQLKLTAAALEERRQIYQNLYEDMAEKLSAIYHNSQTPQLMDAAKSALGELRDTAQNDPVKQYDWNDTLADIKVEFIERTETAQLNLLWDTLNSLPNNMLKPLTRSSLTRIMREALSNIIKHAGASRVNVTIYRSDKLITLLISDNGKGLKNTTAGRGQNNMQRRAESCGGFVEFSSDGAQGSAVKICLPY